MDIVDRKILDLLQRDNQLNADEIGARVGLSSTAVQRRIKKLRKEKAILADVSVVSAKAIGRDMTFIVEVSFERESIALLDKFKRQMQKLPEVQQCYYITGNVDFILILTMKDMEEYEAFTRKVLFKNVNIRRFDTNIVMNTVKAGFELPILS